MVRQFFGFDGERLDPSPFVTLAIWAFDCEADDSAYSTRILNPIWFFSWHLKRDLRLGIPASNATRRPGIVSWEACQLFRASFQILLLPEEQDRVIETLLAYKKLRIRVVFTGTLQARAAAMTAMTKLRHEFGERKLFDKEFLFAIATLESCQLMLPASSLIIIRSQAIPLVARAEQTPTFRAEFEDDGVFGFRHHGHHSEQ